MMMGAAATAEKKRGVPINIDFLREFVGSSPAPSGDDVRFVSTPSPAWKGQAEAKGNPFARFSPDSLDVYPSPPSAPAKGTGKRRRDEEEEEAGGEYSGRSNDSLLRDIADMSDHELRWYIAQIPTFGRLLTQEKRERRQRLLPLLEAEARRRRIRTDWQDGDGRSRAASSMQDVYTFAIEDELTEDASRKYLLKPSTIRSTKKNYGTLSVQTRRSSNQTVPRKPIGVDKMYSSRTSPTALCGHTLRVRAVGPKEHGNEKSWRNENNLYRNCAKRRKAHHEGSSHLHQKVNDDVVLLDDEDVQPDETVEYVVPDKWKDLKIYYPPSDDPEAVELSSLDIRCLNPGVYLSSPVINYYIQYIKRAEMHNEYGTEKFYMFNTYFYSKLQEALLDKGKFLKLRRWWKGVNIFQRGYIILPIHGTSHWSLIIVCMPAKESNSGPIILHLDSLAIHPSAEIFDTVGRYLEEEWRYVRKNPPSDISISDTVWQDLPSNIQKEKAKVPGQNNAYDCGIFMLYYIQEFIRQAPERFTRDSLDMLSRSWFRSEDTSGLRNTIREQLLELFRNANVDDVMPEAAASAGSDDCIMKEGESEAAVTPCEGSGTAAVGGGDTGTRNEEELMEIISLEGSPSTTGRSDGRIGDCALSEAATLSDSVKDAADDDTMKVDSDGSKKADQDIEILSSGSSKNSEEAMCGLLGLNMSRDDTMKIDSDISKAEQDVEILPSGSSKNSEEVLRGLPGLDYCDDSCDSDVEEVDHRSWKAKKPHFSQIC
ncbi:unnamed protein product [Alopecurus aequalis]